MLDCATVGPQRAHGWVPGVRDPDDSFPLPAGDLPQVSICSIAYSGTLPQGSWPESGRLIAAERRATRPRWAQAHCSGVRGFPQTRRLFAWLHRWMGNGQFHAVPPSSIGERKVRIWRGKRYFVYYFVIIVRVFSYSASRCSRIRPYVCTYTRIYIYSCTRVYPHACVERSPHVYFRV